MIRPYAAQAPTTDPGTRAHRRAAPPRRAGGYRRAAALAACAVAVATGLAACSKAAPSGSVASTTGAFGGVPTASGTAHAGTLTWAESPGSSPTWIFPVTPGANFTVTTIDSFQFEMWRPLYWYGNGVRPVLVPSMSMADMPVYSNGDKTVTVHLTASR